MLGNLFAGPANLIEGAAAATAAALAGVSTLELLLIVVPSIVTLLVGVALYLWEGGV
jgi:hypothetical protein